MYLRVLLIYPVSFYWRKLISLFQQRSSTNSFMIRNETDYNSPSPCRDLPGSNLDRSSVCSHSPCEFMCPSALFCIPLPHRELSLEGRALTKIFLLVMNALWSLIVCTLSTWPSQCWDSACPEPVQVLRVLPQFLWNHMSNWSVALSWKTPFPQGQESHLSLRVFLTPLSCRSEPWEEETTTPCNVLEHHLNSATWSAG